MAARIKQMDPSVPDFPYDLPIDAFKMCIRDRRYFETYLRESTEGPPRKYYHITAAGVLYRDRLEQEWDEFQKQVCRFLKEQKDE